MEPKARKVIDEYWRGVLGLDLADLAAGVYVVTAEIGLNDAMSFLFDDVCVVATRSEHTGRAKDLAAGRRTTDVFAAEFLEQLIGPDARIDGPSWHGYVTADSFRGTRDDAVRLLDGGSAELRDLEAVVDPDEWAEGGFVADSRTTKFYGLEHDGRLVAAGNMTEWRGLPADVGLVTRADARGRGLATKVAATMVADALSAASVVRYRALLSNAASLAIATGLGFECYGQNYRARRRQPGR